MNIIRRSAGLAIVLLSVLGLLLCIAGAAGIWLGKSRVDVVVAALFGTADDAFEFMDTRLEHVHQALDGTRQRVDGLSALAQRLRDTEAEPDVSAEVEPLLQALDNARDELRAAEHWLDSIHAIAGGVHRVSESIAAARTEDESAMVTGAKVAEFSAGVVDALERLQGMRQELVNLQEKKVLAREFAAAMINRVAELDSRLANLAVRIDDFDAKLSTALASNVDLGRSVHWWVTFATVMLTLVGLWFGLSQVCMIRRAWQFVGHPTHVDSARGSAGRVG